VQQICARFEDSDYELIDKQATATDSTRPKVVKKLVESALKRQQSGVSEESNQAELLTRIKTLEQQAQEKASEIGFLRQEFSKINDALSRRLLEETKPEETKSKGAWARVSGWLRGESRK